LDILTDTNTKRSKKNSSLLLLLIITAVVLAIVAFSAVFTFLSYKQANTKLDNLIKERKQTINQTALLITKSAEKMEDSLASVSISEEIQKLLSEDTSEARENMLKVFEKYKAMYPGVESIYLGTAEKQMYIFPRLELPVDYDPTGRSWYRNASNNKEFTWSEPYMDVITGDIIISLSLPLYNENELMGVLSTDLKFDSIVEEIKSIEFGKTGYLMITDQNGMVVFHPAKEKLGLPSQIESISELTAEEDTGIINYSFNGKEQIAIYSKIDKLKMNLIGLLRD
jgi:methyl-accepting chemotaxis protein